MRAISLKNKGSHRYLRGLDLTRAADLSRSLSTPFMVLRTSVVRHNLRRLRAALPGVDVFYAVKANNHPDIIGVLRDENCFFDISSVRELETVRGCGVSVENTIHTNPIKSPAEFDGAVAMGVRTFVADNLAELDKFSRYGDKAGVLLRFKTFTDGSAINLSFKFGADPQDMPLLLDRVSQLGLDFRGFCFHVGSQCLKSAPYVAAIKTAGELIRLAAAKGLPTEILDIGGGFPIRYTQSTPSLESLGAAIVRSLKADIDPAIRVICEPGRCLSGEAATLFASVIGKSVRGGVTWYYIDDGLYGSFSGRVYDDCAYEVLTQRNTRWEKAVLAGPTCDSFDVIYKDCLMPPLDVGDVLMFPAMGAYCLVSASDFNGLGRARVVTVDW